MAPWSYESLESADRSRLAREALDQALRRHGFDVRDTPGASSSIVAVRGARTLEIWPRTVWHDNPLWIKGRFIPAPGLWACAVLLRDGSPPAPYLVPSQRWLEPDDVFTTRRNHHTPSEWTIRMLRQSLPAELREFEVDRVLGSLPVVVADEAISDALQAELVRRARDEVTAVEAAAWLDELGILTDSVDRRGLPLRNRLRAGRVAGAVQRPPGDHGRWFITRSRDDGRLGLPYTPVDESTTHAVPDLFAVDPAIVERGQQSHARLQNLLAEWVERRGAEPLEPLPGGPQYDLCWREGGTICVAEVKSLTDDNEERQLRLALGQVLRYRHRLRARAEDVRAVLMVEREPADPGWRSLCRELDVRLLWPGLLRRAADPDTSAA